MSPRERKLERRWREHLEGLDLPFEDLEFPAPGDETLDQDAEFCRLRIDGTEKVVRFHDYDDVFSIPGLYETIFYEHLRCTSPARVAGLLEDVCREYGQPMEELSVLDVGAGNGMVGEELRASGVPKLVGMDIIPEAKVATDRDRPDVYDDYYIADLTDLPERVEEAVRKQRLNTLVTVAALGFGDIPAKAFLKAFDMIESTGWVAFNIKEDFLSDANETGFSRLIKQMSTDGLLQIYAYRRYQHRLSMAGKPLYYVGLIGRKLRDVPSELMDSV
jgi:predicted TPR repeat methyltransferase